MRWEWDGKIMVGNLCVIRVHIPVHCGNGGRHTAKKNGKEMCFPPEKLIFYGESQLACVGR